MYLDIFEFKDDDGNLLYTITLDKIIDENGKQTWVYTINRISGKNISNWALELCKDANVVGFMPEGAIVEDPNTSSGLGNCLNQNNPIGCNVYVDKQIKWNSSGGTFEFTLDRLYKPTQVYVAIKAGTDCFCGTILGPSCEEIISKGILFG